MESNIEFFTATCLNWNHLLREDTHKQIVLDSLAFLVKEKRIWLYAYVIMPNHIHLLWAKQDDWSAKNVQLQFMKFTAQQIKFSLIKYFPDRLAAYKSTQADRIYHFWERNPWIATMRSRKVFEQKLAYIHYNPVKAGFVTREEDYQFSSARFYLGEETQQGLITHYMEHI